MCIICRSFFNISGSKSLFGGEERRAARKILRRTQRNANLCCSGVLTIFFNLFQQKKRMRHEGACVCRVYKEKISARASVISKPKILRLP